MNARSGGLEPRGEGRMPFANREEFLEQQGDVYLGVLNALHRMEGELEKLKGAEEAQPLRRRTGMVREQLKISDGVGRQEHGFLAGAAQRAADEHAFTSHAD